MSRAESGYGRRGRRGGARRSGRIEEYAEDLGPDHYADDHDDYDPEEDFSAEYGHTHTRSGAATGAEYEADDHDDGDDEYDAPPERGRGRRGRRSRRPDQGNKRVGKVSAFSASAIKRVSVLGDRPQQIVYTLAEQSKRKRGTAALAVLLTAFGMALIALLALLSYQLYTNTGGAASGGEDSVVAPPEGHSTLTPELYLSEPNNEETFAAIDERDPEAEPMTDEAVFGQAEELSLNGVEMQMQQSAVHDSCTSLVWGDELGQSLLDANCVNAASALYTDSDQEYVSQVTLFDLSDSEGAEQVAAALDPTNADTDAGFLLARTGDEVPGLQDGYSQATTQVMGHYLAVFWSAGVDGEPPGDDSDLATVNVVSMNSVQYVFDEVVRNGGGSQENEE